MKRTGLVVSGGLRRLVNWRLLTGFAVAVALALFAVGTARAALVQFAATVDGAQETPANLSPAMATGTFTMDTDANTLSVNVVITVPPPSGELFSHIHGFQPPGIPAGIVFNLPNGSPKIAVWNFVEGDQAGIINGLTYVNIHSFALPGGEIRGQILRVPSCGDGILDGGEQCDDGNTADGDCCDSACQFEPNGSDCIGASLCDFGQCDGAGTCVSAIRTGCKTALKSFLLLKHPSDDTKHKLVFKWLKGAQTSLAELGVPTGTTSYALCIYAGTTALFADIPPDMVLWEPKGTTGFKYKNPAFTPDGIQKVILKSGDAGKAKAIAKGKGTNLPDPPANPLTLPVIAQLVNESGTCFEGQFDMSDVIKNENDQFKAKAQ